MRADSPEAKETLFEEMKRCVRFGGADARALAELGSHAAPRFERIADELYDRVREHEANDLLVDDVQVERLKRSLVRWLERVCGGPYDQDSFEETAVRLPPHAMFTATALVRVSLSRIANETMGERAQAACEALSKALDLELSFMLGAGAERRYQHAVELARVLIVGLDAQAIVRLYNREAERVTGFPRDEVLGRAFAVLFPEGVREEQGPIFGQAAAGGRPFPEVLEGAILTRSGKVRDVRWQLACSPLEADDEVVLFAVGQDTTDENALAARVRRSEKLAAVGTLAAGLAHEIRNPLNGARLHLTFLERGLRRAGVKDSDTHEAVRVVGDEIRRLSELVSEFLDFARPNPLDQELCSIRALCERAVQIVGPSAEASQVTLSLELLEKDIELEIDGAKVEQVLLNVLQNAVEAIAPTGGGSVVVRSRRQPRRVVIEVEDDGPGLSSPDAPIFDAFFSTKPQGTGLGLAIAHRIVTDHGGEIDVTSHPGKTIFRIALPIRPT